MSTATVAAIDIVRQHVDAFSRQDWETWKASVTPDMTYEEPATGRKLTGADAAVQGVKAWTLAFPDLRGTITNAFAGDGQVTAEILWEGTHRGPLAGPLGELAPSGRSGTVRAVEVVEFEGDKIKAIRHYFDMLGLLAQIGALPGR